MKKMCKKGKEPEEEDEAQEGKVPKKKSSFKHRKTSSAYHAARLAAKNAGMSVEKAKECGRAAAAKVASEIDAGLLKETWKAVWYEGHKSNMSCMAKQQQLLHVSESLICCAFAFMWCSVSWLGTLGLGTLGCAFRGWALWHFGVWHFGVHLEPKWP